MMNSRSFSTWLPIVAILLGSGPGIATATDNVPDPATLNHPLQSDEDKVFYAMGYGSSGKFSKLGMSRHEIEQALQGFFDGLMRAQPKVDILDLQATVDKVTGPRLKAFDRKLAKEGKDFYDSYVKQKGVQVTESGLAYRILEPGAENQEGLVSDEQFVEVHYEGKLHNGTVFDSSHQRNQSTEFQIRTVLKGWREGIRLVKPGGKIHMVLPPGLAYGVHGRPPLVPPNATLQFEVELLKILSEKESLARKSLRAKPAGHGYH